MYWAVPTTAAVWVMVSEVVALAMPKSITLTLPSGVSITLPGLMSRWMRPRAWAAIRALQTSAQTSAARSGYSGPSARITSLRVRPSTYSMTMKWVPSSVPVSYTPTMLGWLRLAAAWASRLNRIRKLGSRANWAWSTLMATRRASSRSRPSNTSAMPPAPSRRPTS